jgi:hypothetical protein
VRQLVNGKRPRSKLSPVIFIVQSGYLDALRKEGGVADWWELPKLGVNGNAHVLIMDKNSEQIAQMTRSGWPTRT